MQKWEYKHFYIGGDKVIFSDSREISLHHLEDEVKQFGLEGWELCAVYRLPELPEIKFNYKWIFKRPIE